MTLTFDQLRSFIAVAEELHFGRAAERLHVAQPSITRQVQGLERHLKVSLIDRHSRRVQLTAAGADFLGEARRIISVTDGAVGVARAVDAGQAGRLTVGLTATAATTVLSELLRAQRRLLPRLRVELAEHVSEEQELELQEGRLHLGMLRRLESPSDFVVRVVHRERLMLALPANHELTRAGSQISTDLLDGEAMIRYSPTKAKYFADITNGVLAGIRPRTTQTVTQVLTVCSLVAAGEGIGLVPESMTSVGLPGVTFRAIRDLGDPVVQLLVAHLTKDPHPAVEPLLSEAFGPA